MRTGQAFFTQSQTSQTGFHNMGAVHGCGIRWVKCRVQFDQIKTDDIGLCTQATNHCDRLAHVDTTRYWCTGCNSKCRVNDVDIKRDMDLPTFFTGFSNDTINHVIPAALLDFRHGVETHADLAHPFERFLIGSAGTQTYLNVVSTTHMTFIEQAVDRRTVADQVSAAPPGVVV